MRTRWIRLEGTVKSETSGGVTAATLGRIMLLLPAFVLLLACSATEKDIKQYKRQHRVAELVAIVEDNNDKEVRIKAINALGGTRDPRAIHALGVRLRKADSWVEREAAVTSLGYIRDLLVLDHLIYALDDENDFVKESARKNLFKVCKSLGDKKDSRLIRPLLKAIKEHPGVSQELIEQALLKAISQLRRVYEPTFIKELVEALKDEDRYVRRAAVQSLMQFADPRAISPLISILNDPVAELRALASEALRNNKDPRLLEPLYKALGDPVEVVRDEAARAFLDLRDFVDHKVLLQALGSSNPDMREGAAKAMSYVMHPDSQQALIDKLDDPVARVRLAVARTLERYQWQTEDKALLARVCVARQRWDDCLALGPDAIAALKFALSDQDTDIRDKAADTLATLEWKPLSEQDQVSFCIARRDWKTCRDLGLLAVDPLIKELDNKDLEVQLAVVQTLAAINHPRAIMPLVFTLEADDVTLKLEVIDALGRFLSIDIVEPLLRGIDNDSHIVRKAAFDTLWEALPGLIKLNDDKLIFPFLKAMKDNNRNVRKAAAQFLGELKDPRGADSLVAALEDVDVEVRSQARSSLMEIKDNKSIGVLVKALGNDDPKIRAQIVTALSEFKDHRAIEPLFSAIKDSNSNVRLEVVKVLSKLDDPRGASHLVSALKDVIPEIRAAAALALAHYQDRATVAPLVASLLDVDVRVRMAARQALKELNWQPANDKERALQMVAQENWEACVALGHHSLEPLLLEARQKESGLQISAIRTLGEIRDKSTIDALLTILSETRWLYDEKQKKETISTLVSAVSKYRYDAVQELVDSLPDWYLGAITVNVLEGFGWSPRTKEERIRAYIARRDSTQLQADWKRVQKLLMQDIASAKTPHVNTALYIIIGMGREELLDELVKIINEKGDLSIAEAYLNSDHPRLIAAAEQWSAEQALAIHQYDKGNQPVLWGQLAPKND